MVESPKTLLAWAGAQRDPSALTRATILLIDCQLEYVSGHLPLPGVGAALAQLAALLERARRAEAPVIHVVHHGSPGGLFDPAGPLAALAPEVSRSEMEPMVVKRFPNAFTGTSLQGALELLGRKELIVAGFMTHLCVSSTVRAARQAAGAPVADLEPRVGAAQEEEKVPLVTFHSSDQGDVEVKTGSRAHPAEPPPEPPR